MKTKCPNCKSRFNVNETSIGKQAKCPKCTKPFAIEPFVETPVAIEPSANSSEPIESPAKTKGAVMKKCPYCSEEIQDDAIKCKFCREFLPQNQIVGQELHKNIVVEDPQFTSSTSTHLIDAEYRDMTSLTKKVKIFFFIAIAIVALTWFSDILQLHLLHRIINGGIYTKEQVELNDTRQVVISIVLFVVESIAFILFLMWVYRANKNARALGAEAMQFSPGWAVGYYFIPILFLYKPYQAMKEIWCAIANPNGDKWKYDKASSIVGNWWALFIISSVLDFMAWKIISNAKDADSIFGGIVVSAITEIIKIPYYLVAVSMISQLLVLQINNSKSEV